MNDTTLVNKMFKIAKDEYEGRIPSHIEQIRQMKEKIADDQKRVTELEKELAETQAFVDHCCKTYGFSEGFFQHSTWVGFPRIPALFLTRNDAKYAEGKTKYEWSQDERLQGRDLSVYGRIETPRASRS